MKNPEVEVGLKVLISTPDGVMTTEISDGTLSYLNSHLPNELALYIPEAAVRLFEIVSVDRDAETVTLKPWPDGYGDCELTAHTRFLRRVLA